MTLIPPYYGVVIIVVLNGKRHGYHITSQYGPYKNPKIITTIRKNNKNKNKSCKPHQR